MFFYIEADRYTIVPKYWDKKNHIGPEVTDYSPAVDQLFISIKPCVGLDITSLSCICGHAWVKQSRGRLIEKSLSGATRGQNSAGRERGLSVKFHCGAVTHDELKRSQKRKYEVHRVQVHCGELRVLSQRQLTVPSFEKQQDESGFKIPSVGIFAVCIQHFCLWIFVATLSLNHKYHTTWFFICC